MSLEQGYQFSQPIGGGSIWETCLKIVIVFSTQFGDTDLTLDLNGHRAEIHTHTHTTSLKHMPNKPRFYTLFKRTQG